MSKLSYLKTKYPSQGKEVCEKSTMKIFEGVVSAMGVGANPLTVAEDLAFHYVSSIYALCGNSRLSENEMMDVMIDVIEKARNRTSSYERAMA